MFLVDKIDISDKKKFDYFILQGNIYFEHYRGHDTLIVGIFFKD